MSRYAAILPRNNTVPVVKMCASKEDAQKEATTLAMRSAGKPAFVVQVIDEYVLLPRVVGHTAVEA